MALSDADESVHRVAGIRGYIAAIPTDLVAVTGFALLATLVVLGSEASPPVRALFGLPLLFFLPGYALVSVLFPGRFDRHEDDVAARVADESAEEGQLGPVTGGVTGYERIALGFGTSIALLPVLAIVLSVAGAGLSAVPVVGMLTLLVVVGAIASAVRRFRLPAKRRFNARIPTRIGASAKAAFDRSILDAGLSILLAVAVVVGVVALTYGLAVPTDGESYTELSLLSGSGDAPAASDYPSEVERDESASVVVEVGNFEGESVTYTVVVQIQRVETEDGSVTAREWAELDRFQTTVDDGDRWRDTHTFEPGMTGDDLRVVYLLYSGDPPEDPAVENAYRSTHFWIDVPE